MAVNAHLFAPSAAFKRKVQAINQQTQRLDREIDQTLLDLKVVVRDTLDKLNRVEKISLLKRAAV